LFSAALLTPLATTVLLFVPLSPAYDLDVFLRAGHAVAHGLSLYPVPSSRAVYSGSSFVYPYFAAWPFAPLAGLSPDLARAVFFALCAYAVVAAALPSADGDPWAAVLVLCTSFTITGLQLGALSPLLFAGVVFLWRLRDRPVALGLLAAPVIASKLFLLPLLGWLLLARRYRAFAWASVSTIALLAAGFIAGPLGPASYAQLLTSLGTHETRAGFGLIGALINLGLAPGVAEGSAAVLAAGVFALAYIHRRRTGDERTLYGAGIVSSLLLCPVVWSHYLVLLPAALLALGASRRWFVALALASWAIAPPHGVNFHTDLLGIASSGSWLTVLACYAMFALSARLIRRSSERQSRPR
jgi:alpha-1,2-mannosyltransferase